MIELPCQSHLLKTHVKAPHRTIPKTCKAIFLVTHFQNVCNKPQKAIRAIRLGYQITIGLLCVDRGPSQFCEKSAMVTNCVTDPPG